MSIAHVTTYVSDGLALLPQQYKGKPRITAWLTTYLTCFQGIEDCAWQLFTDRLIQNNPTGDLLAKIGIIVGQTSLGYTDSVFKLLIRARIMTNRSTGQKRSMIRIAAALTSGLTIMSFNLPLTTFYMQPIGPYTVDPYVMVSQFLGRAIGAGVRLVFVYTPQADSLTLLWGSTYGGVTPTATQVPGSTYAAGGGKWGGGLEG